MCTSKHVVRLAAAALCGACSLAFAPSAAYSGRPCATEDAGVAGEGEVTMEFSCDCARKADGDEFLVLAAPGIGLTQRIELSLEVPYYSADPGAGIGDVVIAGKYVVCEQTPHRPALAVKIGLKTPSGDANAGLGSGATDYTATTALSYNWQRWLVHAAASCAFIGGHATGPAEHVWGGGLAGELQLATGLCAVAEVTGARSDIGSGQSNQATALGGMTVRLGPNLVWDAAGSLGLTDAAPRWGMTIGCSVTF